MARTTDEVLIVGAGLAGLRAALRLHAHGIPATVLDAADDVGGRVRTDRLDGFLLDRGFQVFLTRYEEARRVLDYDALDLKPFIPGALVRADGRFHRFVDPSRRPLDAPATFLSGVGTPADKLRVGRVRLRVAGTSPSRLLVREPERTTLEALRAEGFSDGMIERFFRPFFGGVFLEKGLVTSSRLFEYLFRCFALGATALPAGGMGAIPRQMASALPAEWIRLNARVARADQDGVTLEGGRRLPARAVVVATDGTAAARLTGALPAPGWRGSTTLYFAAESGPIGEPLLAIDGENRGPVNSVAELSAVAPSYAPPGATLLSASCVGVPGKGLPPLDDAGLVAAAREQLTDWFGPAVRGWRHLRTYRIAEGLPDQSAGSLTEFPPSVRLRRGLYVCGDHRDTAAIQGALASGRRAADALIADLA
jgi:phytoene dehydrogenase-like protein